MSSVPTGEIVKKAAEMTRNNVSWHHHHLPPHCHFSKESSKYQLILENEETKEIWVAKTDEKPLDDLKKLEDLYFRKKFP
jgi:ribosomal protein L24